MKTAGTNNSDISMSLEETVNLFQKLIQTDQNILELTLSESEELPDPIEWLNQVITVTSKLSVFPEGTLRCWLDENYTLLRSILAVFFNTEEPETVDLPIETLNVIFCKFICQSLGGYLFFKSEEDRLLVRNLTSVSEIKSRFKSESERRILESISKRNKPVETESLSQSSNISSNSSPVGVGDFESTSPETKDKIFEAYEYLTEVSAKTDKNDVSAYSSTMIKAVEAQVRKHNLKQADMAKLIATCITIKNPATSHQHSEPSQALIKNLENTDSANIHDKHCVKCRPHTRPDEVKIDPNVTALRNSVWTLINFSTLLKSHNFQFRCYHLKPLPGKGEPLTMTPTEMETYICQILTRKLKCVRVPGNYSMFCHPFYGYVLPHKNTVLLFSKSPDDLLMNLQKYMVVISKEDHYFKFYDLEFIFEDPDAMTIDTSHTDRSLRDAVFTNEEGKSFTYYTENFPLLLKQNPLENQELHIKEHIQHLKETKAIRWPEGLIYEEKTAVKKIAKAMKALNYTKTYLKEGYEEDYASLVFFNTSPNELMYYILINLLFYSSICGGSRLFFYLNQKQEFIIKILLPYKNLDHADRTLVYASYSINTPENRWLADGEVLDITDCGTMVERIYTTDKALKIILSQQRFFESLDVVQYYHEPKYELYVYNTAFFRALNEGKTPKTVCHESEAKFEDILDVIDKLKIKIKRGEALFNYNPRS